MLIPFQMAKEFIDEYKTNQYELEAYDLPYPETPNKIINFVSNLKATKDKTERFSEDTILNLELVKKYS